MINNYHLLFISSNPTPNLYITKTIINTPTNTHITKTTHIPQKTQNKSTQNQQQHHLYTNNTQTPTNIIINTSLLNLQSNKHLLHFQSSITLQKLSISSI